MPYKNKEDRKINSAKWYEENKEDSKKRCKKWREENKEYCKEMNKKWREENKEKLKEKVKELITCECGKTLTKTNISRHRKEWCFIHTPRLTNTIDKRI